MATPGSVAIRRFEPGDAPRLHEAVSESIKELAFWMVWCRPDYSLTDATRFVSRHDTLWQQKERFDLAIYHPETGTLLGSIGLSRLDLHHGCANIGYWVRTNWTNQGIGRNAIKQAARFAFEELGLNRLEFLIETDNQASLQAAKRAGAVEEAVLRKRFVLRGGLRDCVLLSLVRD